MSTVFSHSKTPQEMETEFKNYNILSQFLLNQIRQKFNQLIPQTPSRKKRGLINGLGSIIKLITGNMDNEDLQQIENRLENLEKGNNDRTEILNSQISLAKESIAEFNYTVRNLSLNQHTLKIKILQLERAINVERTKRYHILHTSIVYTQILIMAQNILEILETIEESITFAKLQVMHPSIIQPENLLQSLKEIDKSINLPFPLQADQILNYENLIKIKAYQIENKLKFLLEIPIIDKVDYNLYHIYSCPTLKNGSFQTIIPNEKYLALSNQYYSSLNNVCTLVNKIYYCNNLNLVSLSKNPICSSQLILAQKPYSQCKIHYFDLLKAKIQFIENNIILLISPSEIPITYDCNQNSQNHILPKGTYLLSKFENCKLKIDNENILIIEKEINQKLIIPHLNYSFNTTYNYTIEKIDLLPINLDNLNVIKYKLEKQQDLTKLSNNKIDHVYIPSLWTILLYIIIICFSIYILYKLKTRLQEKARPNQPKEEPIELHP